MFYDAFKIWFFYTLYFRVLREKKKVDKFALYVQRSHLSLTLELSVCIYICIWRIKWNATKSIAKYNVWPVAQKEIKIKIRKKKGPGCQAGAVRISKSKRAVVLWRGPLRNVTFVTDFSKIGTVILSLYKKKIKRRWTALIMTFVHISSWLDSSPPSKFSKNW